MENEIALFFAQNPIMKNIYDTARIVDPVEKRVISHALDNEIIEESKCYNIWGKNKVCDNCISMRTYNDNSTNVKIEYKNDKVFLVTAVPYNLDGRRVVIELMKDITDSMTLGSTENSKTGTNDIHSLIDNMNKLAFKDPLTGIYNRRYINEKLPVDILNCLLNSKKIALIIADIDFFKKVNDNYGHIAGDYVLKSFAKILEGCLKRSSDWIARYGGEEFLICLPGAELDTSLATAESMRKATEEALILFDEKEIRITSSFGLYFFKPGKNDSVDYVIKCADEKLYLAKRNGRNRVEY